MAIPAIGETVTAEWAQALCQDFGLADLAQRIKAQPGAFKDWVFDGASMLPDDQVARLFHIPHLIEIALRHDLKYAYGEPGNAAERLQADETFRQELLDDGADSKVAKVMYRSVRLGGSGLIKTSFSWGFARV